MASVLLIVHVFGAVLFLGGSAVAASLFPRYAPVPVAVGSPASTPGDPAAGRPGATGGEADRAPATAALDSGPDAQRSGAVAAALHRVTRGYGAIAVIVPLAGIVLALLQGRLGELWIVLSLVLSLLAGLVLALLVVPRQRTALADPDRRHLGGLHMGAGIYNLLWTAVLVLMVLQPG